LTVNTFAIDFIELGAFQSCEGEDAGANYTYVYTYTLDSSCQNGSPVTDWSIIARQQNNQLNVINVHILAFSSYPAGGMYWGICAPN